MGAVFKRSPAMPPNASRKGLLLSTFFNGAASAPMRWRIALIQATGGWWNTGYNTLYIADTGSAVTALADALAAELQPGNLLYLTAADAAARMQYTWMSSPGLRTHTHFDSDHNVFVQLIGRKRFVLWAPNQTAHLCPFPRLHPLWHKSRADFEAPDTSLPPCANYSRAEAIVADVERKPPPSATNQLPPCEAATECMRCAPQQSGAT